jgi:hypothetical protein
MSFPVFGVHKKSKLEQEIDHVLDQLATLDADSKEYSKAVKNLDALCKVASYKKDSSISADTLITVTANILGIVLVLGYEQAHVVTSKALSFIVKPKI